MINLVVSGIERRPITERIIKRLPLLESVSISRGRATKQVVTISNEKCFKLSFVMKYIQIGDLGFRKTGVDGVNKRL